MSSTIIINLILNPNKQWILNFVKGSSVSEMEPYKTTYNTMKLRYVGVSRKCGRTKILPINKALPGDLEKIIKIYKEFEKMFEEELENEDAVREYFSELADRICTDPN